MQKPSKFVSFAKANSLVLLLAAACGPALESEPIVYSSQMLSAAGSGAPSATTDETLCIPRSTIGVPQVNPIAASPASISDPHVAAWPLGANEPPKLDPPRLEAFREPMLPDRVAPCLEQAPTPAPVPVQRDKSDILKKLQESKKK